MEYKLLEENINHVQNEVAKAKDKIAELKPMEQAKVFSYFSLFMRCPETRNVRAK